MTSTKETQQVADRFYELITTNKSEQIIEELYAEDATHVEAYEMEGMPKVTQGKENLLKSMKAFMEANEFHDEGTNPPFACDDKFICYMWMEITAKQGPMAGQRMKMEEYCSYTVDNGKITRAEFYYKM